MAPRGRTIDVEISALGARGDGVASVGGEQVFVPYTVPGDRLRVRISGDGRGEPMERSADGPDRIDAACRHFTRCGGCAVQHVKDDAYAAWKRDIVQMALRRRNLDVPVAPLVRTSQGTRRRVRFSAKRLARQTLLGFREARNHRLVDIAECPVAAPEIVALIAPLRALLGDVLPQNATAEISVTLVDAGLDLLIQAALDLDLRARECLASFAEDHDLARLSWMIEGEVPEPVTARRAPQMKVGDGAVVLSPGGFVQPTDAGEANLRAHVMDALGEEGKVADLYAGMGAFGLPLALRGAAVVAADSDPAALAALDAAARKAGSGDRLSVDVRDIDRRPFAVKELDRFDGIVLDPPRAGAAVQVAELAQSAVPVIAYVSCNPATFARDARTLVDGGYDLGTVTPVDQFLWSPHVELVGIFRR